MGYNGMGAREDPTWSTDSAARDYENGNAHLRRIAIEAASAYRHRPAVGASYGSAKPP
jgi:hypothetical protein